MSTKQMDKLAFILVVVGALNWGMVGSFNIDLLQLVLGSSPALLQLAYIVVGLAGLYLLYQMTSKSKK